MFVWAKIAKSLRKINTTTAELCRENTLIGEKNMVFGLFKKNEYADVIYKGGKIYTLNPDLPRARAVACKDGRVIAVGDEDTVDEFKGKHTEIIDIEGGTMLPGFIDICGHPVLQAFQKACLIVYDDMSEETVLQLLSDYIKINPDKHAYFVYGFDTSILIGKTQKELQEKLDKICDDRPVVMLDISGIEGWFNTKALDVVRATVEEEEQMPIITLPYILHVLAPVDFDKLQAEIVSLSAEYCEKGYTAVFDCGAPDYLHSIYQEMVIELFQAEMLRQRFLGSFLVIRNVKPDYVGKKLIQKKTACSETEEHVNCNVLKLILDGARTAEPNDMKITLNSLKAYLVEAIDKGFNVHIDAVQKSDVADAIEAIFHARTSNNRKSHFTIAHPHEFTEEERMEFLVEKDTRETDFTLGDFKRKFVSLNDVKNTFDAADKLTIDAASHLGISDDFGSIETGKYADFVVFEEDPFGLDLSKFKETKAWITIIGGDIVYNSKVDNPDEWQKKLKLKQQEINELLEEEDDEIFN